MKFFRGYELPLWQQIAVVAGLSSLVASILVGITQVGVYATGTSIEQLQVLIDTVASYRHFLGDLGWLLILIGFQPIGSRGIRIGAYSRHLVVLLLSAASLVITGYQLLKDVLVLTGSLPFAGPRPAIWTLLIPVLVLLCVVWRRKSDTGTASASQEASA